VLLVGDPDQLPPVGPGRPLAAALAAKLLPCLDLRHIYRSAAGSAIIQAAHAINQGEADREAKRDKAAGCCGLLRWL
jgi:exodeoxyribonuclease V alpha subunit